MKNIIRLFFIFCVTSGIAQSTAIYDFTFTSIWNETDHTSIPNDPHWSNLVGAVHKTEDAFLKIGELASTGIKNVAEIGNNTIFNNEVNAAISSNDAKQWLQESFSPRGALSSATISAVEFTEAFHLITLVSMVAPSPDWFIAINSLDLRNLENTEWKNSFSVDVFVYDAGTDDGTDYASPNSANSPVGISMINGLPINGNKIGTLEVTLKSVLGTNSFSKERIKVYPNPSHGHIIIDNMQNLDLKSIQFYDILGKQVKNIIPEIGVTKMKINVNDLKKGIYLLKVETSLGFYKNHKIIVN